MKNKLFRCDQALGGTFIVTSTTTTLTVTA